MPGPWHGRGNSNIQTRPSTFSKLKLSRKDTTSFLPTKKNGCEAEPIREVLLFLLDRQIIIPEENFTEQTGFFLLQVTFIWFGG